jgi:hypothetical protein
MFVPLIKFERLDRFYLTFLGVDEQRLPGVLDDRLMIYYINKLK